MVPGGLPVGIRLDSKVGSGYCRGVKRWSLLSCLIFLWPIGAAADEMDPELARLRLSAGEAGCTAAAGYCPDLALFERLVSELAIAAAPPSLVPAPTSGVRGVWLGIVHTVTSIDGSGAHWRAATGDDTVDATAPMLHWTRVLVRKGLPLGLELGGHVGHGMHTSMWTLGGQVKLAVLEGFQTGLGRLPDMALTFSTQGLFGARDLRLMTSGLDWTLSKSWVVGGAFRLTPLAVGQLLWVRAESGFVDLSWPACDAQDPCREVEPLAESNAAGVDTFGRLTQLRVRWALGAELARGALRFLLSAAVEGPTHALRYRSEQDSQARAALQFAMNGALAVEF